jgi:hypothetical protein
MTHSNRRRGTLLAAILMLGTFVLVAGGWEAAASGSAPRSSSMTLSQLKIGLGCWESGGRYDIRNGSSGAFGKYQIMPANWPGWARQYLGSGHAPQTPANQEQVASGKLQELHTWLNAWDRVLYWWLTGSTSQDRAHWSPTATRYVAGILSMARRAATPRGRATLPGSCLSTPARAGQGGRHQTDRRRVTVASLHVRAHAGTESASLGFLARGDVVTVLDRTRDGRGRTWIHVARNGSPDGWVARWFTLRLR